MQMKAQLVLWYLSAAMMELARIKQEHYATANFDLIGWQGCHLRMIYAVRLLLKRILSAPNAKSDFNRAKRAQGSVQRDFCYFPNRTRETNLITCRLIVNKR